MFDPSLNIFVIPNMLFYILCTIVLTILYQREFKTFFSFCYGVCVMWFFSSWWEIPSWLVGVVTSNHELWQIAEQSLSLLYFFPLLIFVGVFNVKLELTMWKIFGLICGLVFAGCVVTFTPNYFETYPNSPVELLYLLQRIVNLLPLAWLFNPDVRKCRFKIGRCSEG